MKRGRRLFLRASAAGALLGAQDTLSVGNDIRTDDAYKALRLSILDTLVPSMDGRPGALAIGLGNTPLSDIATGNPVGRHLDNAATAAQWVARLWHDQSFAELDVERREDILLAILGPWATGRPRPVQLEVIHVRALQLVRKVVLDRFYTHPDGQASVGYHAPWPRGYREPDIG